MATSRNQGSTGKPLAAPVGLHSAVQYLRGAGPYLGGVLHGLGVETIQDLLFHLPLRYEDRRQATPIGQLKGGEDALVLGRIGAAAVGFTGKRRTLRVSIEDASGSLLLRFFHFNEAQRTALQPGRWLRAYGAVRGGIGGMEMVHPEYRVAERAEDLPTEARLTPIYPLTAGLSQVKLRSLIQQALELAARDRSLLLGLPGLPLPDSLSALKLIHQPEADSDARLLMAQQHPAQGRLLREELLAHQLCMRLLRRQVKTRPAPRLPDLAAAQTALQAVLPFTLTGAQRRVLAEVAEDLLLQRPMLRLVQGDVGSGKTVVAAVALLAAARAGYQAALMAPTELLAEQHAVNLGRWLAPLGLSVAFLAGKLKKSQKDAALAAIAAGEVSLAVGTHAMFQQSVAFAKLALVVVDEQHRFGVQQRLALRDKGPAGLSPHQLIMSATPIPRTLAQTLYADLDVSVIDELPPGRTPITTVALVNERRPELTSRIGEACRQGKQAYWVCTLIEDSDELEAQAAETTAAQLRAALPGLHIGLVHGRMKPAEKEAQMAAFKDGKTQLLVATTVIEVGVDVPNASIMVIENAERLGLAQLHQLRGRVGRGAVESQCVLLYQPPLGPLGRARLDTLRRSTDGFEIAQKDLELRGPGELLGRRQTGVIGLKLADPQRDAQLIPELQRLADDWLDRQPELARLLIRRWVGDVEKYAQV
ncbi:MAG: ATP-dependent DNA helicase RecG [Nevskiaceae bacterium]|nr:MAG: ATP-dependent DNA helicase RecG [Nevskiaceae bacterium]